MNEVKALYDEAARRFLPRGKEAPLVPVNLFFSARRDTGAVLSAGEVTVTGGTSRRKPPDDPGNGGKIALKTGGTPFYVKNMHIEVEDGLVVPASVMNGMRRDALSLLLATRSVAPSRDWMGGNVLPRDEEAAAREGFRGYTASIRTEAQAKALEGLGLEAVYAPLEVAARTGLPAVLPRVFFRQRAGADRNAARRGDEPGNGHGSRRQHRPIPMAKRLGFTVHGDFGLNAYNSRTLFALAEMGVSRQTLSFEARLAQIRDMSGTARDRPYRLRPSAAHDLRKLRHPPSARRKNARKKRRDRADRPPARELSAAARIRLPQHAHRQPSAVSARGFRAARRADRASAVHNGKSGGVRTHRTRVPQRCAARGRVHARLI